MTAVEQAANGMATALGQAAERLGRTLTIEGAAQLQRGSPVLGPTRDPRRAACRLLRARDGWLAVNLARETDFESAPAWLGLPGPVTDWATIEAEVSQRETGDLLVMARLLGLAISAVGEVEEGSLRLRRKDIGKARRTGAPTVLDLSALWAGPLCAALLGEAGLSVTRLENTRRPDPTPTSRPVLDARLNGGKTRLALDFGDRERLKDYIQSADIVVTSARPRAFDAMGIDPECLIADSPGLIWVAISGYGWLGSAPDRVAFGDDAAAAGGLVTWEDGRPALLGDAVADPLTGMAAALAVLDALDAGGGCLIDAAMASVAAGARLQ